MLRDGKADLDDRIARSFSRAVTRRTALRRTLRFSLAGGATISSWGWWFVPGASAATGCGFYGQQGSSCYCASTPSCPSSVCGSGGEVADYHKRCNAWTQPNDGGQYCWCSARCNLGPPGTGKYVCCDGWRETGNGCANTEGGTRHPCICANRVYG